MYLPTLYNRVSGRIRTLPAAVVAVALVGVAGCESTAKTTRPKAAVSTAAPTSDVRRIDAYQDAEQVARAGSGRAAVVGKGESMAPIYGDTTMLVITQLPFDQLAPGMVVAYRNRRGAEVVHRLVARTRDGAWRAQGINNPEEDAEPVTRLNYVGVVYASLAHDSDELPILIPARPSDGGDAPGNP